MCFLGVSKKASMVVLQVATNSKAQYRKGPKVAILIWYLQDICARIIAQHSGTWQKITLACPGMQLYQGHLDHYPAIFATLHLWATVWHIDTWHDGTCVLQAQYR